MFVTDSIRDSSAGSGIGTLAVASLGFVILTLLVLAITPILMTRRLDEMQRNTTARLDPSEDLARELRVLLADEVMQFVTLEVVSDSIVTGRYIASREREDIALNQLMREAPRVGDEAVQIALEMRAGLTRFHSAADSLAVDLPAMLRNSERLARLRGLRDEVVATDDSLLAAIARARLADQERGRRLVMGQRLVSGALGILALVAVFSVGLGARREQRLVRRLEHSLDEEARFRTEAEQKQTELESVSESRAHLTRGFSHDVKNPLGAADGYLSLLEEGMFDAVTPKQQEILAKSRRSIAAALNLIEDLLEIARAETGNIKINSIPTDLNVVVLEAVEEYRAQAEAKGLTLDIGSTAALPQIWSDPTRVRQVLGNLISNAVKYTPAGTVRVTTLLSDEDARAERMGVEIRDTGIGIAPEKLPLLFHEFSRFEPGAAKGAGMGLAISYRIAQALGGDISVETEPGIGSRFVLWLPVTNGVANTQISASGEPAAQTTGQ